MIKTMIMTLDKDAKHFCTDEKSFSVHLLHQHTHRHRLRISSHSTLEILATGQRIQEIGPREFREVFPRSVKLDQWT
jgi:hypothetical protein